MRNKIYEYFKAQPLTGILCLAAALVPFLGTSSMLFVNIFANDGVYNTTAAPFGAVSVIYGIISAVCAVIVMYSVFVSKRDTYIIAVSAGIIFRLSAAFFWSIPLESDFETTFYISQSLADIPFSGWSKYILSLNTPYAGEWSVHMPFIIYQAVIMKILPARAISIRFVNAVLSQLVCVLSASISGTLFGKRAKMRTAWITALCPVLIFFVPVLTNQHCALFFFMLSVWTAIKNPFKKEHITFALSGLFAGISQLIRPEMYVYAAAVIMFLIYGGVKSKNIKKSVINGALFLSVFFSVLIISDKCLQVLGIISGSVFDGNLLYKIMTGLNTETLGKWNSADFALVGNNSAIRALLLQRLSHPFKITALIIQKLLYQFGTYVYPWAMRDGVISSLIYRRFGSAFMFIISALCGCTLIFSQKNRGRLFLLYITMLGYMGVFGIIEVQDRYNYLLVPILIIIASGFTTR